jgi:hypothetical protein
MHRPTVFNTRIVRYHFRDINRENKHRPRQILTQRISI